MPLNPQARPALRPAATVAAVCCAPAPAAQAATSFRLRATCIDQLSFVHVVDPHPAAIALCADSASDEFHGSSSEARVELRLGPRKIGVVTYAAGSLTLVDPIPTVLKSEAVSSANLTDRFEMLARDAAGNLVSSGSMDIDLIATGLVSLQGTGSFATPPLPDASLASLAFEFSWSSGRTEDRVSVTAPTSQVVPVSAPITVRASWTAGKPFTFAMSVLAASCVVLGSDGSGTARVVFGNSWDWLGIRNVANAASQPVASFSTISPDSGIDWGAPAVAVREPPATVLSLLGLGALRRLAPRAASPRRSTCVARPKCGCAVDSFVCGRGSRPLTLLRKVSLRRKAQGPLRGRWAYSPAAARSAWALSVRSQVNSGSSLPKCP